MAVEDHHSARLWTVLFVSRHLVIVGLAVAAALLEQFGDDRFLIAGLLVFGVLPYDVAAHAFARSRRRLPSSMPYVYAPLPAAFALVFPETWVPALLAAAGNANLFALTFPVRVALASTVLAAAALAGAALVADPEPAALGYVGFLVVTPAIVLGTSALLQALQLSEERYRDHVENARDIIYTHDLDRLAFLEANGAALRVTGYSRDELGDVRVTDIVAPEYQQEASERIERAVRSDEDPTPWELEIVTKDGRRVPVEVNTRVVRRRGVPVAVQGIARDISERRQIEAQRAALDRARSEFIANAAHELRTPLTTLAGLAEVLASNRPIDQAELEEALEALARQGRRTQMLVDRLLDLTSIELGRTALVEETVAVRAVVEQAIAESDPPEAVDVAVDVDPELLARADHLRLEQILANLLANAYRYGGPHVTVRAEPGGGHVALEVVDDGAGVPEDLEPHLFEPFSRGEASRADGTGLGSAVCAGLAETLGGSIRYRRPAEGGACFRLELPAPVPPTPAAGDGPRA